MNKDNNHINSWSDADVRKYLKGELSARQMHDLERAALDDPFLADALEGLDTAPVEADMDELRSRLAARLQEDEKKELVPVVWFKRRSFRVAAVMILLLGLGVTFYYNSMHSRSPVAFDTVAKSAAKPAPRPPVSDDLVSADKAGADASEAQQPAASAPTRDYEVQPPVATAPVRSNARAKKKDAAGQTRAATGETKAAATQTRAAGETKAIADKPKTEPNEPVTDSLYADVARNSSPVAAKTAVTKDKDPVTKDTIVYNSNLNKSVVRIRGFYKSPQPQPLLFSGRVVDLNNHPLSGASLFLNSTPKIGATTDAAGNFNFRVPPQDTLQKMTVSLVGYQDTYVALDPNILTNNIIQLRQDTKPTLDEVLITGYGANRKETFATVPSIDNTERLDSAWLKVYPVVGKLAYEQYLDTAKRSLKVDTAIHGIEVVSFQVDQKGQITEFKIEQSLSPAHDAGVIQLISGGPAWRLLRGKKARAVVRIGFP